MTKIYNEKEIRKDYHLLTKKLIEKNISITTMESCTSGQLASLISDTEGASGIMKGAFVTYSNESKIKVKKARDIIYAADHSSAFERANIEAVYELNRCEICGDMVCDDCTVYGENLNGGFCCKKCAKSEGQKYE